MSLHPNVEGLALLGWRLYPASSRTRAACFGGATDAATCDLDRLEEWDRRYRGCNWRVVFGGSGIWGLDADVPGPDHAADGVKALADLAAVHGPIPPRPMTRSGGGGLCLFFRHAGEPIIGKTGTPAPGLDPRRGRLSVTVPPSIHPRTGQRYRWIVAPWKVNPPAAPAWLLRLVAPPPERPIPARPPLEAGNELGRRYAMAALRNSIGRVATAQLGARNQTLNRECYGLARFIADGHLTAEEIADSLAIAARQAGLPSREAEDTLRSALRARSGR
jgi:hypothetical protein